MGCRVSNIAGTVLGVSRIKVGSLLKKAAKFAKATYKDTYLRKDRLSSCVPGFKETIHPERSMGIPVLGMRCMSAIASENYVQN